jgi:hypothetical protein
MGETATVKGVEKRGVEKRVENGVVKEDIEMNR